MYVFKAQLELASHPGSTTYQLWDREIHFSFVCLSFFICKVKYNNNNNNSQGCYKDQMS